MTDTNVQVRIARPEDAEWVVQGIKILAEYEGAEDQTIPNVNSMRLELERAESARFSCLIAQIGPEMVGYTIAYQAYVPNVTAWYQHMRDLYVLTDFRKRGVGRELVFRLAELTKQWGQAGIQLEVMTRNVKAIWYYESLGFVSDPGTSSLYLEGDAFESFLRR